MQYDSSELQDLAAITLKCRFSLVALRSQAGTRNLPHSLSSKRKQKENPTAPFGFDRALNSKGHGWTLT